MADVGPILDGVAIERWEIRFTLEGETFSVSRVRNGKADSYPSVSNSREDFWRIASRIRQLAGIQIENPELEHAFDFDHVFSHHDPNGRSLLRVRFSPTKAGGVLEVGFLEARKNVIGLVER